MTYIKTTKYPFELLTLDETAFLLGPSGHQRIPRRQIVIPVGK